MSLSSRVVASFIPKTITGPLHRLVGGLDFKGQGTNHPLLSVDPVVLCDALAAPLMGTGQPPFGMHPHFGLIAISYVLEGTIADNDNLTEDRHINPTGSIYAVSSGRGVCHKEETASEGPNTIIQTVVRIPREKLNLLPQIARVKAEDQPITNLPGGTFRLLVGSNAGKESATLDALPRFILGRLQVESGQTVQVPIDQDLEHGYAYVLSGGNEHAKIGDHNITSEVGLYIFESGHVLEVSNPVGTNTLDLFIAAGKKINNEPWVKLLGHNGFIIASDEEEANAVMAKVDEVGNKFTYKDLVE